MSDKPQVAIREGVVFGRGGGEALACDIYTPPNPQSGAPGVLLVHGASAGAHLVLLAAGTTNRAEFQGDGGHPNVSTAVAATVGIFAPTVLAPRGQKVSGAVPGSAVLEDNDGEEAARLASPLTHVSTGYPPTLLLHGTSDRVVPPSASMRMYEALVDVKVPVELHMVAEQPHGYVVQRDFHRVSCTLIGLFLKRYLGLRPKVDMPSWAQSVV